MPKTTTETAEARLEAGRKLYRDGFFAEARAELEAALTLCADCSATHALLGRLLLDSHEAQAALVHLRRATELDPDDRGVLRALAEALHQVGDYQAAADAFSRAAQGHDDVRCALNAAICRALAGDAARAQADLTTLHERHPGHGDVVLALAQLKARGSAEDLRESRRLLEGLVAAEPGRLDARFELAMLLATAKETEPGLRKRATRELEAVCASRGFPEVLPFAYLAHFALGSCYDDDSADLSRARREYEACLRLHPGFAPALSNLGVIAESSGDVPGALRLFMEAVRSDPDCSQAIRNIARICVTHDDEETAQLLNECLGGGAMPSRALVGVLRAASDHAVAESHAVLCEAVHRLKNRVGVVAGRLESLEREAPDDGSPDGGELSAIRALTEESYNDLRRFLGLLRPPQGEPEVLSVDEVISGAAALMALAAGPRTTVRHEPARRPLLVRVDVERIRDLLVHLCQNALAAIPEGGRITIRSRPAAGRRDWVCVEVSDTGRGIPADRLRDVMRPGVSLHQGGSGLGLWICEQIARAHGGVLSLESTVGEGTTARLLLPPAHAATGPGRQLRPRGAFADALSGPSVAEMGQQAVRDLRLPEEDGG